MSTEPGSRVAGLIGDTLEVSCHHHQSVRTHPGFEASAYAADGTLEAMEAAGERFCVAVQWHPETASDIGLLAGLVRAAAWPEISWIAAAATIRTAASVTSAMENRSCSAQAHDPAPQQRPAGGRRHQRLRD